MVYHLAALASVAKSVEDPLTSHAVCATGTLNVLDAARKAGVGAWSTPRSASAYGGASDPAGQDEDTPLVALSPYAAAKLAGEFYCQAFAATYGLETVRLRFFNVFGPRQRADSPYSGVIAIFAAALAAGKTPTIFGDGQQSRDFVYVSDVAAAIMQAARTPGVSGNVYNVGTGSSVTLLELVAALNRVLGKSITPAHAAARAGDIRHSRAKIDRIRTDLGYRGAGELRGGIATDRRIGFQPVRARTGWKPILRKRCQPQLRPPRRNVRVGLARKNEFGDTPAAELDQSPMIARQGGRVDQFRVLSFDVEEHHRIEAARGVAISRDMKSEYRDRMETTTRRLLDILAKAETRATFFVVGDIARTAPALVRAIHAAGHEVGSHGWKHVRVDRFSPASFRDDARNSKDALEQVTGAPVVGFRAPTFSIYAKDSLGDRRTGGVRIRVRFVDLPGPPRPLRRARTRRAGRFMWRAASTNCSNSRR